MDDESILDILAQLPDLRVLRMDSNPMVPRIRNYRRVVISKIKSLTYLDDGPVGIKERRMNSAWEVGGKQAEMEERHRIRQERYEAERLELKNLRRLQRENLLKSGGNLIDFPELMSSDDENRPRRVIEVTNERDFDPENEEHLDEDEGDDHGTVPVYLEDVRTDVVESHEEVE
jgi:hypothetical protein